MKPETHKSIAKFALKLFTQQKNSSSLRDKLETPRYRQAVLDGTTDEDDITPSRVLNWHFYPSNETIRNEDRDILHIVTVRPTSLWILRKRQKKLLKRLKDGDTVSFFSNFGRILHHIQDMSTPSHVTPIYHGPKIKDPFETYLLENWPLIENELVLMVDKFFSMCESSGIDDSSDFVQVYNNAAERLLKNLESDSELFPIILNSDQDSATSDEFWRPYNSAVDSGKIPLDIKGFGTFGPLGHSFGSCNSYEIAGKYVNVDPEVFQKIAVFFMKSAVKDTIQALLCLEQFYNQQ